MRPLLRKQPDCYTSWQAKQSKRLRDVLPTVAHNLACWQHCWYSAHWFTSCRWAFGHFCGHQDLPWIESMVWLRIVFLLCPECACSVSEWDWKSVFCWSALPATTARSLSLQRLSMPSSGTFSFTLPRHRAIHNYVQTISYLTASCYTCLHHVKNTPQHYYNISCNNYKFEFRGIKPVTSRLWALCCLH